jgi:hypothetical protein
MTRTNAYGLLTVLIRAGALWLALHAAFAVAAALVIGSAREWGIGPFLAVYGALLAQAALLWLFADVLARLSLARPTTPLFESDMAFGEWQRLAFSCIGLWLAAGGLLDVAENALRMVIASRMEPDMDLDASLVPEIAVGVLRLAAGTALLLGARGLVALLALARGRDQPSGPAA